MLFVQLEQRHALHIAKRFIRRLQGRLLHGVRRNHRVPVNVHQVTHLLSLPQRTVIILGDKQNGTSFSYSDHPPVFPIQALYKKGTYLNKAEKYLIELLKKEFDGKGK